MSDQPMDDGLAAVKLRHCMDLQCPYLLKDGLCGFCRARDGEHKGEFVSVAQWQECPGSCPGAWAAKRKGLESS